MAAMKVYFTLYFVIAVFVLACRGAKSLGYFTRSVRFFTLQSLKGFHIILASEWFPMQNVSNFILSVSQIFHARFYFPANCNQPSPAVFVLREIN